MRRAPSLMILQLAATIVVSVGLALALDPSAYSTAVQIPCGTGITPAMPQAYMQSHNAYALVSCTTQVAVWGDPFYATIENVTLYVIGGVTLPNITFLTFTNNVTEFSLYVQGVVMASPSAVSLLHTQVATLNNIFIRIEGCDLRVAYPRLPRESAFLDVLSFTPSRNWRINIFQSSISVLSDQADRTSVVHLRARYSFGFALYFNQSTLTYMMDCRASTSQCNRGDLYEASWLFLQIDEGTVSSTILSSVDSTFEVVVLQPVPDPMSRSPATYVVSVFRMASTAALVSGSSSVYMESFTADIVGGSSVVRCTTLPSLLTMEVPSMNQTMTIRDMTMYHYATGPVNSMEGGRASVGILLMFTATNSVIVFQNVTAFFTTDSGQNVPALIQNTTAVQFGGYLIYNFCVLHTSVTRITNCTLHSNVTRGTTGQLIGLSVVGTSLQSCLCFFQSQEISLNITVTIVSSKVLASAGVYIPRGAYFIVSVTSLHALVILQSNVTMGALEIVDSIVEVEDMSFVNDFAHTLTYPLPPAVDDGVVNFCNLSAVVIAVTGNAGAVRVFPALQSMLADRTQGIISGSWFVFVQLTVIVRRSRVLSSFEHGNWTLSAGVIFSGAIKESSVWITNSDSGLPDSPPPLLLVPSSTITSAIQGSSDAIICYLDCVISQSRFTVVDSDDPFRSLFRAVIGATKIVDSTFVARNVTFAAKQDKASSSLFVDPAVQQALIFADGSVTTFSSSVAVQSTLSLDETNLIVLSHNRIVGLPAVFGDNRTVKLLTTTTTTTTSPSPFRVNTTTGKRLYFLELGCNLWNNEPMSLEEHVLLGQPALPRSFILYPKSAFNGSLMCAGGVTRTQSASLVPPHRQAVVPLSRAITAIGGVAVWTAMVVTAVVPLFSSGFVFSAGLSAMATAQTSFSALRLRAQCRASSLGDTVDPPSSSPLDNPFQAHVDAVGNRLAYSIGAVLANSALVVGIAVFWSCASQLRALVMKRVENNAEGGNGVLMRLLAATVSGRRQLPGSVILPYSLLLQPTVTAAVVMMLTATKAASGGTSTAALCVALGAVSLLATCVPFALFVDRLVWQWPLFCNRGGGFTFPLSAGVRQSVSHPSSSTFYRTLVRLVCARDVWFTSSATPNVKDTAPSTSPAMLLSRYGSIFEGYRRGYHWYFMIELGVGGITSGIVCGVFVALGETEPCVAADWGGWILFVVMLFQLGCYVKCRPLTVPLEQYAAMVTGVLAVLSVFIGQIGVNDEVSSALDVTVVCVSALCILVENIVTMHLRINGAVTAEEEERNGVVVVAAARRARAERRRPRNASSQPPYTGQDCRRNADGEQGYAWWSELNKNQQHLTTREILQILILRVCQQAKSEGTSPRI